MASKNKKRDNNNCRRKKIAARKSMRRSIIGRQQEKNVLDILEKAKERGEFIKVEFHTPNGADDRSGKDFTVVKLVGEEKLYRSFGITISHRRNGHSKLIHPEVPQFWFPIEIKPETIIKTINELFY